MKIQKSDYHLHILHHFCLQLLSSVCVCGELTGQQVSDLLDEVAQLVVALLHPLFALVGFDQHLHSVHLGRVCTVVGLPHLTTNIRQRLTHVHLELFYILRIMFTHHPGELVHLLHRRQDLLVQVFG